MMILLGLFLSCSDKTRPLPVVTSSIFMGKKIRLGGIETVGALDRWMVDTMIKKSFSRIRYCFERELVTQPELLGELEVKLELSPDGTVIHSSISRSTLGSSTIEKCLVQQLNKVDFPNSLDHQRGVVRVPLALYSEE